jgi:hypothetical protein
VSLPAERKCSWPAEFTSNCWKSPVHGGFSEKFPSEKLSFTWEKTMQGMQAMKAMQTMQVMKGMREFRVFINQIFPA